MYSGQSLISVRVSFSFHVYGPYQIARHPFEFKTCLYWGFIFPRNLPLALSSDCHRLEQRFAPWTQEILGTCIFPIVLSYIPQGVKLGWAQELPSPMLTSIYICKLFSWPSIWKDSSTSQNHKQQLQWEHLRARTGAGQGKRGPNTECKGKRNGKASFSQAAHTWLEFELRICQE